MPFYRRCTCGQRGIVVYQPYDQPAGPSNYIRDPGKEEITMAFFNSAVTVLQTLVVALGAGLGTPANQSESLRDWHQDLRCHQAESGLR